MLPLLEGLDIPWEKVDESFFGILLECVCLFYSFIGLAIVCDEHLVPALDTLCIKWKIPEDVAGATFMAFGSAAPEIIIATVTTLQASDSPDPDAIALGVTSIVGSGLLAFSVIPAICGIYGSDPAGLTLKRRPLLRDHLAYLISLLMLMYTIADGQIHVWEAASMLCIYICYLCVIVFAGSARSWYLKKHYPEFYRWKMAQKAEAGAHGHGGHGHGDPMPTEGHYEALGMDSMGKRHPPPEQWGKPIYLNFQQRPLGFKIKEGDQGYNALIASVDDQAHDGSIIGTQITQINEFNCKDGEFDQITRWLQGARLPLQIVFQRPPMEPVHTWSSARVRKWWYDELPPALHGYSAIVEECQLDGSDLFQLDMEMLHEFGVKRIHGMKVLKAVERLRIEQGGLDSEAEKILRKLEMWQISDDVMGKLRSQMDVRGGGRHGGHHGDKHGHGGHGDSDSDHEDHGVFWSVFETVTYPLELILSLTCPDCELGSPGEGYYLVTFFVSFVWVAIFSFLISSLIERWVKLSGMPMSFFGLLVVSIAAQTPDTLESLAVSKKGYGSMAVANCLGTQTINIGIGLAVPWLFSSASGSVIELSEELLIPCWIMIGLLLINLFILYTDVIFRGAEKVILGRTRAYLMSIVYFISIILYAVYLIMKGEL